MAAMPVAMQDERNFYENYILVDTGAYLAHKKYARDLDNVITRAQDSGVLKMIVVSMNVPMSKEALRLTHLYPETLYATAGVHPHEAKLWGPTSYDELRDIGSNPEVVAIGECGLDYNRDFSPKDLQLQAFEEQVRLACELKKPLFLHERDAHADMMAVLKKYQSNLPGGVIHCFTGTVQHAEAYVKMGFHIGINGYLCKDKSDNSVRALLQSTKLPLSRVLVESSAPYMFPNLQGSKFPDSVRQAMTDRSLSYLERYCAFQRNEPCSLPVVVEMVAGMMGKSVEDVALASAFNSLKLFGLS